MNKYSLTKKAVEKRTSSSRFIHLEKEDFRKSPSRFSSDEKYQYTNNRRVINFE